MAGRSDSVFQAGRLAMASGALALPGEISQFFLDFLAASCPFAQGGSGLAGRRDQPETAGSQPRF